MHRTPSSAEATPLQRRQIEELLVRNDAEQRRQIEELLVKKQELDCVLPKDGAVMIDDDRHARPVCQDCGLSICLV